MRSFVRVFVLGGAVGATAMFAQDAKHSDPCDARQNGTTETAKNFLTFDQFDKELRLAISQKDPVALAFLVKFPLVVNDEGGTISLDDAAALKTHFEEVFTPAVRRQILSTKQDDPGCMTAGIMYDQGVIWVNASERGYAIFTVNRDAPAARSKQPTTKIEYVCQTQRHRIVVDTLPGGTLRYRSWNKPRSVMISPDLELTKGESTFEGTNVCAIPIYTFKSGAAVYTVDGGLGCFGDPDGPPKDATGHLQVTVAGKAITDLWCY